MNKYGFINKSGKLAIPAQYGDPLDATDPITGASVSPRAGTGSDWFRPDFYRQDRCRDKAIPGEQPRRHLSRQLRRFRKNAERGLIQKDSASGCGLYRATGAPPGANPW
jgi:hypothetical protein